MSLEGGYIAWLMDVMSAPEEQDKAADVEKSLRKKFKKSIWSKFTKAINTYELVKPGDKNCCLYFRRKRFDVDGEMLSGVKASQ